MVRLGLEVLKRKIRRRIFASPLSHQIGKSAVRRLSKRLDIGIP
jgi:hypothetical protein